MSSPASASPQSALPTPPAAGAAVVRPSLWEVCRTAAAENLRPGLVLQSIALAILLAYYFWPPVQEALNRLGELKTTYGLVYTAISTAIFGGLIPFLFLRFRAVSGATTPWSHFWFYVPVAAYRGIEVDLFYRLQEWLWGNDLAGLIGKVLFDQLVFTAIYATPTAILIYAFRDAQFSFRRWWHLPWRSIFATRMAPLLVSNWIVWFPAVTLLYLMPPALQIPFANLVQCFWMLMVLSITRR